MMGNKLSFDFRVLEISGVVLIEPKVSIDTRGFFMETYRLADFSKFGIKERFVQDNHSKSALKGVLRGFHFQLNPKAQSKLIRVISGGIFDVVVDLRKGSSTFGKWVSVVLTSVNKLMLYIPKGFAHGFCTLENDTEVIYKCSEEYYPEYERGIIWNDREINVSWPIENPILSEKDKILPTLKQAMIDGIINA